MEGGTTIVKAFTTAATAIAAQAQDVILGLLPIALPVLGLVVVIGIGKRVLKSSMK